MALQRSVRVGTANQVDDVTNINTGISQAGTVLAMGNAKLMMYTQHHVVANNT